METILKKGRDIQPGDIVKNQGIAVEVEEYNPTAEGPSLLYYDINDSYLGACLMHLDLEEEYEIITDRQEGLRIFKIIDNDLAKGIADMVEQRMRCDKFYWTFINEKNMELKNVKKTEEKR